MEYYSPTTGFMTLTENSSESVYDQNVPSTPNFLHCITSHYSSDDQDVPFSPSGESHSSCLTNPSPKTPLNLPNVYLSGITAAANTSKNTSNQSTESPFVVPCLSFSDLDCLGSPIIASSPATPMLANQQSKLQIANIGEPSEGAQKVQLLGLETPTSTRQLPSKFVTPASKGVLTVASFSASAPSSSMFSEGSRSTMTSSLTACSPIITRKIVTSRSCLLTPSPVHRNIQPKQDSRKTLKSFSTTSEDARSTHNVNRLTTTSDERRRLTSKMLAPTAPQGCVSHLGDSSSANLSVISGNRTSYTAFNKSSHPAKLKATTKREKRYLSKSRLNEA